MSIWSRILGRREARAERRQSPPSEALARQTTRRPEPKVEFLDPGGETGPGRKPPTNRVPGKPAAPERPRAARSAADPDRTVEDRLDALFAHGGLHEAGSAARAGAASPTDPTLVEHELELHDEEAEQTLELFGNIAALYIRPVQQFVQHLRRGPYTSEGLEMCVPAVEMVTRSAESMGAVELVPLLNEFNDALGEAVGQDEPTVDGRLRDRILTAYAALERVLPEAFALGETVGPADDVILYSLLRQIPEVGTVTLDKVFGAGLTSIDMFELATPRDLSVTAGIPEHLAQRICVRVHGYIVERRSVSGHDATAERLARLKSLLAELRAHHEALEDLRDPETDSREARGRRRHRRAREDAALKIHVVLAEMGERGLVEELLKLPFGRRLERLSDHVAQLGRTPQGR